MIHKLGFEAIYPTKYSQLSMVALYLNGKLFESVCHRGRFQALYCFLFYINDLPTVAKHSQVHADDTPLYSCGTDLMVAQEQFQQDVDWVQGWMRSNRLPLNVAKG